MENNFRRRGFTLIELLVVMGIIALLISILVPVLSKARESSNRSVCASNLRQIGQAIAIYGTDNDSQYPRTFDSAGSGKAGPAGQAAIQAPGCSNAGYDQPDPFTATLGPSGVPIQNNSVTGALFLLLRTGTLNTSKVFICPDTTMKADDYQGQSVQVRSNFTRLGPDGGNLSYSYANPYASPAVAGSGFNLSTALNPAFATMSDINPGTTPASDNPSLATGPAAPADDQKKANSNNHGKKGQNVLFADGHVEFCTTVWVGVGRNNIYVKDGIVDANGLSTTSPRGVKQIPNDLNDSIMLPTDDDIFTVP